MRQVCVLMSTYNGESFIKEQVNSIMHQKEVEVELIIRDDFSTDNTVDKVKKMQKQYNNITLIEGKENIGWKDSFLTLLYYGKGLPYEYYAFSDQDDIWLEDKLISACNLIDNEMEEIPILYIANRTIINTEGQILYEICEDKKFIYNGTGKKKVAMDENVVAFGCVQIFNKKLLNLATYSDINMVLKRRISHDHWMGMVAMYFGKIIYENKSHILHRQHPNSVTNSGIKHKKKIFKIHTNYAKTFYDFFKMSGLLNEADERYLKQFGGEYKKSFVGKVRILLDPELKYKTILGTLRFKVEILLSKI